MASVNKPPAISAPLGPGDTSLTSPTYNHPTRHNSGGKCLPPFPKCAASPEPRSLSRSPSLSPTIPPESSKKLPYNLDNLHPDDARDKVFVAIIKALLIMGNKPSSPKELANCIMKQRFTILGGATPYATVSSRISQHFKRASEHKPPRKPILGRAVDSRYSRKIHYYLATDDSPPVRPRTPPPSSQSSVLPATATPTGVSGSGKKRQPRARPSGSISSKRPRLTVQDHISPVPSLPNASTSSPTHLSSEPEVEEDIMVSSSQLHRLVRSISAYDEPPFNNERPFNMPIPGRGKWVPRYSLPTSTGSSVAVTRNTSPDRQPYNGTGQADVGMSSTTDKYSRESGDGLPISPAPSPPVSLTAPDHQKTRPMAPPDIYRVSNFNVSDKMVDFHEEMMSGHLADNVSPLILPTNPPPASRTSRASSPVPLVNLHEEIEPLLLQVQARQNHGLSRKGSVQGPSVCGAIEPTHLTPRSSHTSRNASTENLNPCQAHKEPSDSLHVQEEPRSQDDKIFAKRSPSTSKSPSATTTTTSPAPLGSYSGLAPMATTPRRNPLPPSSTILSSSPFGSSVFWQTSPLPFDSIFAAFPSQHRREGYTPLDSDITEEESVANNRPLGGRVLRQDLQSARDKVSSKSLSVPASDPDDLEMVFNEPSSVSPSLAGSDDENFPAITEETDCLRLESLSLEPGNALRGSNSGSGESATSSGPVPIRIRTTNCESGIIVEGVPRMGSSYGSYGGLNEFHDPEAMSLSEIEQLWASSRCRTGGLPNSETNPAELEAQEDTTTLHCRCIGGPLTRKAADDVRDMGKTTDQFLDILGNNNGLYSDTIVGPTPRQRSLSTSGFVQDRLRSFGLVNDSSDKDHRTSIVPASPFGTRSHFRSNATPLEPVLEHEVAPQGLNATQGEGTTDWALICSSSLPDSLSNLSLKPGNPSKSSVNGSALDDASHRRVSSWLAATRRQGTVLSTLASDSRKRYSSRETLITVNDSRVHLGYSSPSGRISHRLSRSFTSEKCTSPLWLTNLRSYELGNRLLTTQADKVNRLTCSEGPTQNRPQVRCLRCGRVFSNRETNPTGAQVTATNESPGAPTTQSDCPSERGIGTTTDTLADEGVTPPRSDSEGIPGQDQTLSQSDSQVVSPATSKADTTDAASLKGFVNKLYGDVQVREALIKGTDGKLMQVVGAGPKPPIHSGRRSAIAVSSQLKPDEHLGYVNATQLRRAARVTLGEGKLDLRDTNHRQAVALRTGPQESRGLWVPLAVAQELMIEFRLRDRPEVQIFLAAVGSPSLPETADAEGVDATPEDDNSSAPHSSPTLSANVPMIEDDIPAPLLSPTSAELDAKGQDRSTVFSSRSVSALRSSLPLITPSALTTRSLLTAISALAKAKGSTFNLPAAALESDLGGLLSSAPSALAKSIGSGGDGSKPEGSGPDDSTDMTSSSFASTFSSLLASTLNSRPSPNLNDRIPRKDAGPAASTISTTGVTPTIDVGAGGQTGEGKTISPFTALLNRTIAALQKHRQQQQLQKQPSTSSVLDTAVVINPPAAKATPSATKSNPTSSKSPNSANTVASTSTSTSITTESEATKGADIEPKLKPSTPSSQDRTSPPLLCPENQTLGKSSTTGQTSATVSSTSVLSGEKGGKKPRVISASYAAALAARTEAEGEDTPPPRPDCIPTRINVTPRIYLTIIESTPFYIVEVGPRQGFKRSHTLLRRADTGYVNAERLLSAGGVESDQERSIVLSLEVDRYRYPSTDSELYGSWIPLPRARALAATCSLHHKLGPFLNDNLQTYFPAQLPPAYAKLVRCRPLPLENCYGLARTTSALTGLRSAFGRDRGPILRPNALGASTLLGGTLSDTASSSTGAASSGMSEMLVPPSSLHHLFANKGESPSSTLASSSPLTLGRSVSFQQPVGLSGSTAPGPLGAKGKSGEGNALAQLNQLLHAEGKKATVAPDHARTPSVQTPGSGKPTKVVGTTSLPSTGRRELPFYLATALSMASAVGEAVNVVTPQALQKNTATWSHSVDVNARADSVHTADELGQSGRKPRRRKNKHPLPSTSSTVAGGSTAKKAKCDPGPVGPTAQSGGQSSVTGSSDGPAGALPATTEPPAVYHTPLFSSSFSLFAPTELKATPHPDLSSVIDSGRGKNTTTPQHHSPESASGSASGPSSRRKTTGGTAGTGVRGRGGTRGESTTLRPNGKPVVARHGGDVVRRSVQSADESDEVDVEA